MIEKTDLDKRAIELHRLGLTVRVRYVCPTNTKGGRYVAEVCGDENPARVYVGSQLCNRCESTRLAAAELCLSKWIKARSDWWIKETGKPLEGKPFQIRSVGHDGKAWLFFTN